MRENSLQLLVFTPSAAVTFVSAFHLLGGGGGRVQLWSPIGLV